LLSELSEQYPGNALFASEYAKGMNPSDGYGTLTDDQVKNLIRRWSDKDAVSLLRAPNGPCRSWIGASSNGKVQYKNE
jgi:hypothetical protein